MNKYIPISLALALVLSLGACGDGTVKSYVDSVKAVVGDIKVPNVLKDITVPEFIKNIEIKPTPETDPSDDTN